jgi:hypothetical protein
VATQRQTMDSSALLKALHVTKEERNTLADQVAQLSSA